MGDPYESDPHTLSVNKNARLIEWNVEILLGLLKRVVARRKAGQGKRSSAATKECAVQPKGMTIDEVCEVIRLPKFDAELAKKERDPGSIEIPANVIKQLRDFVYQIEKLYRNNVSMNGLPIFADF